MRKQYACNGIINETSVSYDTIYRCNCSETVPMMMHGAAWTACGTLLYTDAVYPSATAVGSSRSNCQVSQKDIIPHSTPLPR